MKKLEEYVRSIPDFPEPGIYCLPEWDKVHIKKGDCYEKA